MIDWEEILQKYVIAPSDKIQKVTRPLKEQLGLAYFTYHRVDLEGKYTVLVDRPDWAEHYVGKKIYLNDPYLRHPSVYTSGVCLVGDHGSEEYKETVLKDGLEQFKMDAGLLLIEKKEAYVEFFGFAGTKKNCDFTKLYLNELPLLYAFSAYFKEELDKLLERQKKEAHSLLFSKKRDFFCTDPISPSIASAKKENFLKAIGMGECLKQASLLSKREKSCLEILSEGKSFKEIAWILELSPRTVEFYFENIKNKLGVYHKGDLIKKAKTFSSFHLL